VQAGCLRYHNDQDGRSTTYGTKKEIKMYVIVSKPVRTSIQSATEIFGEIVKNLIDKGCKPLLCKDKTGLYIARETDNRDHFIGISYRRPLILEDKQINIVKEF